jgi:hypothetical protein
MFKRITILALSIAALACAQTPNQITGYNLVTGQFDQSTAARTNPCRQGTGSPNGRDAAVKVGECYFQTDASAGANIWYATALPSTWTNNPGTSGTITGVTAGTGLSGGGTSGAVTLALAAPSGTTASIGGGALTASCATGTVTLTGVLSTQGLIATPAADITGGGSTAFSVIAWKSGTNTVTVSVCGTGTPTATTYNVRIIP